MDAHAHLLSLGWAGPGHSLDSRPHLQHKGRRGLAYDPSLKKNTGRGLVKPLLISQKKNSFGIGKKAHEPAAGNEWWLKGFEDTLSKIGKDRGGEKSSGTTTPESGNRSIYSGKHAGLYGFFVKGQELVGTIGKEARQRSRGKKRKSDAIDDIEHGWTNSDTRPMSQEKLESSSEAVKDFEQISQFLSIRDKDQQRGGKRAKADLTQEFEQMGQFFETVQPRKKSPRKTTDDDTYDVFSEANQKPKRREEEANVRNASLSVKPSDKEQRREERRAARSAAEHSKKKEKKTKTALSRVTALSSCTPTAQGPSLQAETTMSMDEALRKAERKKRKEQKRLGKTQAVG